ncbi:MAG: AAA family ATPase [Euryarchaeota archaeon]|jgi:predicted cytidylate kinase|nr:AAA family ATPase [Euryarchaeota archaeon]
MVKITVSGHPGSGTSTLVNKLVESMNWTSLNGGDIFRSEAKKRSMTLSDFGELCKNDLQVDRELDDLLKEKMSGADSVDIIESRLAGWWAHLLNLDCVRLWIDVSDEVRAQRVVAREGGTISQALEANAKRSAIDASRFNELYNILPQDPEAYTHVVDASEMSIDEVLSCVVNILEEFK